jgi:hypothetical protein
MAFVNRKESEELLYLECRDWGHAWNLIFLAREAPGVLVRRLECVRCSTTRFDYLTRTSGEVDGRVYHYPEEYLFTGEGRPDKNMLRRDLTRALFKQDKYKTAALPDDMPRRRSRG